MTRVVRIAGLCALLLVVHLSTARAVAAEEATAPGQARYLVIGSYIAEIMVALGAAGRIVGVGSGTDHIPELAGVPRIPGFRNTSAEPMLALRPTVALLAGRQTRPEVVGQLEGAGVAVQVFPDDVASLEVVPERIDRIGRLLDRKDEADALRKRFRAELDAALAFAAQAEARPRGLFILSGGGRPTLVAGADTHIALLIELAGADNVTDGIAYFKPMSQEAMLEAAPDFILVNEEGLELSGGVPVALKAPGATLTPAGRSGNVFALPGGYLQGLGLNSPKAIRAIAERVHPGLGGGAE